MATEGRPLIEFLGIPPEEERMAREGPPPRRKESPMTDKATLLALLKERHEFPEFPHPAEGEVTDADLAAEQEQWRVRFDDLDRRIHEALGEPLAEAHCPDCEVSGSTDPVVRGTVHRLHHQRD